MTFEWDMLKVGWKIVRRLWVPKPRFLIVEDDAHDIELLERVIDKLGYEHDIATKADIAEGIVRSRRYTAILLDLRFRQGMSGIDLLRRLDAERSDETVIITCGAAEDLAALPASCPVWVIVKPVTIDAMRKVLNRIRL